LKANAFALFGWKAFAQSRAILSESSDPKTLDEHKSVAKQGGEVALNARKELEQKTGKKVISNLNTKTGILLKGKR